MGIFEHLMETGWMPLKALPEVPAPLTVEGDRLAGMLWGVYLGDALGNSCESQAPTARRQRYGELYHYLNDQGRASDDSQLAFWTLEHLLEHDRVVPQRLAERFTREPVRGLGRTVRAFLAGCQEGLPWHECAVDSLGNGSLMRIAPVLAPFLRQPSDLWPNVAVAAALTHRSAGAVATCLAFVDLLRALMELPGAPREGFYRGRFLATLERCCPDAEFCRRVRQAVEFAVERSVPVMELRSGASLLETVPALLLLLDRYGAEPEEAVARAVNDTYDNDSLASMVGACMGALHGLQGFPSRWLLGLEPTVSAQGHPVDVMIKQAVKRWAGPTRRARSSWELVRERLGSLRVGGPVTQGSLHLIPLLGPDLAVDVDLLEEAPRLELSEVGQVDQLRGINQGARPVLLLDGEELSGGLQNRMLRSHVLIGASQRVALPVSCVERGRWGSPTGFRAGGHLAPPSVRSGRSQAEVWNQVEGQLTRTRTRTQTRSISAAYARVGRLEVPPLRGQVGMLVLLGERVLCLEVVGSQDLYRRVHEKLLASLALEAYGVRAPKPASRRGSAARFVATVRSLRRSCTSRGVGLGSALRFEAGGVRGQALVHDGRVLCLSAFPAERA